MNPGTHYRRLTGSYRIVNYPSGDVQAIIVASVWANARPASDVAIFEDTNGTWRILQSSTGTLRSVLSHGSRITASVPGDYDGDRRANFAEFSAARHRHPRSGPVGVGCRGGCTPPLPFSPPELLALPPGNGFVFATLNPREKETLYRVLAHVAGVNLPGSASSSPIGR